MCDFPDFTLTSALNDFAGWLGFNYFFYLIGVAAFLWFLQKYYRGLKAERGYFPSVYTRLLIEFILLNATAMAAWISYSCKDWDDSEGVVVHALYVFWLFTFALQIASLFGPGLVWVSAFITALSCMLALVNVVLCAVYVWNLWSLLIHVVTFVYLLYMAGNLIIATVWPDKGSRALADSIAAYADAWDVGVLNCTKGCAYTIRKQVISPENQVYYTQDGDMTSGTEASGTDVEGEDTGDEGFTTDDDEVPKQSRMGQQMLNRRNVVNPTAFSLPQ